MRDFYERFYKVAPQSRAHQDFCARVFGADLCQHGFADVSQLDALMAVLALRPGQHALDLGCGNGLIAEYISDRTGAYITGLDYIPLAVEQAAERTAAKRDRLAFVMGDINALQLSAGQFDAIISVDTLYFGEDLPHTVGQLKAALRPGGQMGLFYSHGWEPWKPKEEFDASTLVPESTPLGVALAASHLAFTAQDFTEDDKRLAHLRKAVLEDLRPQFEAQGLMFIYENRMGDAQGIAGSIAAELHRRYLYHVRS